MVDGSSVWGIISGALGLTSPIAAFVCHQLPSKKFQVLDNTLREAESLLSSSVEGGLIPDSGLAAKFMKRAEQLRDHIERVRPEVYRAKTNWQQLKGIASGLTKKLSILSDDVLDLRAEISVTRETERQRLRKEVDLAHPQETAGVVTDGASVSVPLGGLGGTAASRFYSLDSVPARGIPGYEITSVDFAVARDGGPRSPGSAEAVTAHACCCSGHGHAHQPYPPSSKPLAVLRHSYSTPTLRLEGVDAVNDRPEPPTMHPGPGGSPSPDTPSPSDVPYCDAGATCDVVVDIPHHRCSR